MELRPPPSLSPSSHILSSSFIDSFALDQLTHDTMDLKDTEVERQMTMGKKDAGHQEMIEKAALSPLLAPLTPEEFAKADKRVSSRF